MARVKTERMAKVCVECSVSLVEALDDGSQKGSMGSK